jgi:hypothetical protein
MKKIELWAYRLGSAIVGGAATALSAQAGLGVAHGLAPDVVQLLDWKQFAATALTGGIFSAVAYLKQSPLPPIDEEDGR